MARKQKNTESVVHGEVTGIALQVVWALLLLALASYSYRDVPMGGSSPLNDPMQNYIGPVGAYVAWLVFQLFGIVGFLLPLAIALAGVILLWKPAQRIWPRIAWMGAMLLALSILADMQTSAWHDLLANKLNMLSMPGGWIGWLLGRNGLQHVIGPVGTALLAIGILVAGVFFVAQAHPAELFKLLRGGFGEWRTRLRERREAARAQADEAARLQERIERERIKTEREELKNEIMRRELERKEEERQRREEERLRKEEERIALQALREKERVRKEREDQERQLERERKEQERQREKERKEEEKRLAEEAEKAAEAARQAELERARIEEEERQAKAKAEQEERARKLREEAEKRRQQREAAAAAAAQQEPPVPAPPPEWNLPPLSMLQPIPSDAGASRSGPEDIQKTITTIEDTLRQFGIESKVMNIAQGPVVTRYEVLPAADVKVERIASYAGNITLALKAESTRVQAPIPGKGVVGIEVPHKNPTAVVMRQLLESPAWTTSKANLPMALGLDLGGQILMADLAKLPHLLIAGATGMGKTVCMNSLIAGLLMTRTPEQLRLILVDPKIVEFASYNGLPHLLAPVINDAKKVTLALDWALQEMQRRFQLFKEARVRDIDGYNKRVRVRQQTLFDLEATEASAEAAHDQALAEEVAHDQDAPDHAPAKTVAEQVADAENATHASPTSAIARLVEPPQPPQPEDKPAILPYIVIIVDEPAELMGVAQKEIEPKIQRITQLARATGIHMILATQRPTVNIITGTIKANVPGRVAFKVAQKNDSRVILDEDGADALVPHGDMLVKTATGRLVRAQGAWTKDEEIMAIADFWKSQGAPQFDPELQKKLTGKGGGKASSDSSSRSSGDDEDAEDDGEEDLIRQVLEVIRTKKRASTSTIQRALGLGYNRAARIMDTLEERGYIGPSKGAAPRDILFDVTQPFDWEDDLAFPDDDEDDLSADAPDPEE